MLAVVEKYQEAIRKARSDADILTVLRQIANQLGFRSGYMIEYSRSSRGYEHVVDTDEARAMAWASYFNGQLHDPVRMAETLASADVMMVTEASFSGVDDPLLQFCKDNDLLDSVVIPVHHAGETVGAAGFSGSFSTERFQRLALQLVTYNLFAQMRAIKKSGIKPVTVRLTAREKEVMRLAADGMTSEEVARLLGMSARTANQHINNVAAKLGTKNRTHTVAEAIRHSLLT